MWEIVYKFRHPHRSLVGHQLGREAAERRAKKAMAIAGSGVVGYTLRKIS